MLVISDNNLSLSLFYQVCYILANNPVINIVVLTKTNKMWLSSIQGFSLKRLTYILLTVYILANTVVIYISQIKKK